MSTGHELAVPWSLDVCLLSRVQISLIHLDRSSALTAVWCGLCREMQFSEKLKTWDRQYRVTSNVNGWMRKAQAAAKAVQDNVNEQASKANVKSKLDFRHSKRGGAFLGRGRREGKRGLVRPRTRHVVCGMCACAWGCR